MRLTFPCFLRLCIVSIRLITKTQERKPQVREMCLRDKGWCSRQKAQDFIDNAKQFLTLSCSLIGLPAEISRLLTVALF